MTTEIAIADATAQTTTNGSTNPPSADVTIIVNTKYRRARGA
jgi:hypothetical protein